jgi:hypothetical protein
MTHNIIFFVADVPTFFVAIPWNPANLHHLHGNFRILKWSYVTIFLAIFSGNIP